MDRTRIINRLHNHLDYFKEKNQYNWFFISLVGSQNYNLDDELSDIDSKLWVFPSYETIYKGTRLINYIEEISIGDDKCEIKDFRLLFENLKKQNINFVETLFSKYCIVNPFYATYFYELQDYREVIGFYDTPRFLQTMLGQMETRYKKIQSEEVSIEKKAKHLYQILRIEEFVKRFFNGEKYEDCLVSKQREALLIVKRNKENFSLSGIKDLARTSIDYTKEDINSYLKRLDLTLINIEKEKMDIFFNNLTKQMMTQYLKKVLE